MKKLAAIFMSIILMISVFTACGQESAKSEAADLVVIGTIYTVDDQSSTASALAVKDGVYVYVGDEEGVQSYIDDSTEVVTLEDGMALPSFGDGHAHGSLAGYEALYEISMYDCTSVEEMLDTVARFVEDHPDLPYYTGTGWMNGYFPPEGPAAALLDEISADVPIAVISGDHHSVWANSKAMEVAGVNADTPDVEAGVIVRDSSGNPTGCFRERAKSLITDHIPGYTVEQAKAAVLAYQEDMVSAGITSYFDPFVANEQAPDKENGNLLQAYAELGKAGEMLLRVYGGYGLSPDYDPLVEVGKAAALKEETASDQFSITAVKIVLDGVIEGRTGYLLEDYADEAGYRGEQKWPQDLLNETCVKADELGLQIHIHAIGDAALRQAVDALEHVTAQNGTTENRHVITHLQLADPADAARMGELGIIASVNFDWHFKEDAYFYELEVPYLGEERANSEYPAKLFFDSGCVVAAASDYPVGLPASPLMEIEIGVTRSNPWTGDPATCLNPGQKVSVPDMIRAVTFNQAYQHYSEDQFGSIEVGKSADLVLLDTNILEIDPQDIYETSVLRTILRGETIYPVQ